MISFFSLKGDTVQQWFAEKNATHK
jgi:hypothetical protein